jgi:hypothetical protein
MILVVVSLLLALVSALFVYLLKLEHQHEQKPFSRGAAQPYLKHPAVSSASFMNAVRWTPRPTDVAIVTYTKCGTTWLQQICHQLRTGGDMNYEEITAVSPWLDFALDCGVVLEDEQTGASGEPLVPRVWKSHQRLAAINCGCKYIVTLRDPARFSGSKPRMPPLCALDGDLD